MVSVRVWHTLAIAGLLAACASAADDDARRLQDFLEDETRAAATGDQAVDPAELDELNLAFAREAARSSGYALVGVSPPEGEAWYPLLSVSDQARPADVSRWLE